MQHWLSHHYLTLNPDKTQIFAPDEPFTFLGYRFAAGSATPPPQPSRKISASNLTGNSRLIKLAK
jgi:CRISP-associated protein Cas1